MVSDEEGRCDWCLGSDLYIAYHDTEWGVPCRDERLLFEMLCLEGAQAGLSWITILRRREGYRRVFADFDARTLATFDERDIARALRDPGIVRHRGKIESVVKNARAVLAMEERGITLATFVWAFVDGMPLQNCPATLADVPASTPLSTAMSRALKREGFTFVGPTTAYAFMQAAGLVNDHVAACPRQAACAMLATDNA